MTDGTDWNIGTLKYFFDQQLVKLNQYFDNRIEENQQRSDERWNSLSARLDTEHEALDKRFESANRYRETFSDRISEAPTREEMNTKIESLRTKIEDAARTPWPLYISLAGFMAMLVGGLWTVIGLQIQATVQPISKDVGQIQIGIENIHKSIDDVKTEHNHLVQNVSDTGAARNKSISELMQMGEASKVDRAQLNDRIRQLEGQVSSSGQADVNSKTDRAQLNDRVKYLENALSVAEADRKANEAAMKSALVEIETQFCAGDTVRNLMHANDLRYMSIMWQHLKLGELPTSNAFYPQICNRSINNNSK